MKPHTHSRSVLRKGFFTSLIYFVAVAEWILQDAVTVWRFATVWLVPSPPCVALLSGKQGQSFRGLMCPHFPPSLVVSHLAIEYSATVPLPHGRKSWRFSFQVWKCSSVATEGGFVLVTAVSVEDFLKRNKMSF